MNACSYDLHIHSCLSPCADNDMTPNNIAGVGALVGLRVMALTDHNSSKNCPAFFKAAKRYGIIPIAGMELTTAEDIHAVCLFETLSGALDFDAFVEGHRLLIPNDVVIGIEKNYLHPASEIGLEELPGLLRSFGGICWPAHVDRDANGVIAVLGDFPEIEGIKNAEFYDQTKKKDYLTRYPSLAVKRLLVSSDAHYLWSIREENDLLLIDGDAGSPDEVRHGIFRLLKGESL